ncbi:MAG: hypothetical protein WA087_02970 [Candidatus Saccharimonadales bacterium]
MPEQKYNRLGLILNLVFSFALIVSAVLIVLNRQWIIDQINVWQYSSTVAIDSLVERAGMNDRGLFLYHASQPTLDGTQSFNDSCDRIENTVSVIGCYTNNKIYIYDVTDAQLDGIREVTAAHETLHVAYDRLTVDERIRVGALLEEEFEILKHDAGYADRMAFYDRTEPGERDNELHSVIGTEVSDISSELEAYYDQYFSDRQKAVTLYEKYSSQFKVLKDKADKLAGQLDTLSKSVTKRTAEYNTEAGALNNDIEVFNRRASSGYFASQSEFAAARFALEQRVLTLEELRTQINIDIEKHVVLLVEYNSNAAKSDNLYDSIDSTLAPAPSV